MPCYSVCRPLAFFNTAVSLLPPSPFWLCASHIRAGWRSELFFSSCACHLAMTFGCFEDAPVPLARLLCCIDPQYGFNSKLPWEIFRGTFGASKYGEIVSGFRGISSVADLVPAFSADCLRKHHPTRQSPLILPVPLPQRRRAAVSGWSFRCSRTSSS